MAASKRKLLLRELNTTPVDESMVPISWDTITTYLKPDSSGGRVTFQIPSSIIVFNRPPREALSDPQPGDVELIEGFRDSRAKELFPADYFVTLRSDQSAYPPASVMRTQEAWATPGVGSLPVVGKGSGFTYLSRKGWLALKDRIKAAFEEGDPRWQAIEDYAAVFFDNINASIDIKVAKLRRQAEALEAAKL